MERFTKGRVHETRSMIFNSPRFPGYHAIEQITGWYLIDDPSDDNPFLEGDDWIAFDAAIRRMKDSRHG